MQPAHVLPLASTKTASGAAPVVRESVKLAAGAAHATPGMARQIAVQKSIHHRCFIRFPFLVSVRLADANTGPPRPPLVIGAPT
jgi:hypothetical protein